MMKNELQEIHNSISSMFDYNLETYKSYKKNVERALALIKSIQNEGNAMLTNWKAMGIEELQKELNGRLSEKFIELSPEEQKSVLKFSKMSVSLVLMNIIMNL